MKGQQQPDGSLSGFGAGSTVDALLAIIAAHQDPTGYSQGGSTPVTFLDSKTAELAKTPGGAGKLLIAAAALSKQGHTFSGTQSLIDAINASYDAKTGHYGQDVIGHAFAILGLKAAGQEVPTQATQFLISTQAADGGWAFGGDTKAGESDTNTTAVVLQALTAVNAQQDNGIVIKKGVIYLFNQRNADGGYPYQQGGQFGSESDVNSTAYVAQAWIALGNWTVANEALNYLRNMQKPSGAFQWKKSEPADNAGATYQAIPPLLGATLLTPTGVPVPVVPPGMPSTGLGFADQIAAAVAIALLCIAVGTFARRRFV
jgi:hypothetical protein